MSHRTLYFSHFNISHGDRVPCEVCGQKASDIHHIDARGMGGTSKEEDINNLMALCRYHHDLYGDKEQYMALLIHIHQLKLSFFARYKRK